MKKSLALLLAVLMLVTMFPVSVFAAGDEGDENVVVITEANGVEESASTIDNEEIPEEGYLLEQGYTTFADALAAAKTMTGDVTVEIYDKVTLNENLTGSFDSITFVGMDTDAEIYLDLQGAIYATGKKVAFADLKLSKVAGGYVADAGFMNLAFGVYNAAEVTYTGCIFVNGAYASSGKNTFTGCTFSRSHDRYGFWAYGNADILIDGCTFADFRGIKMYAEGMKRIGNLTVKNTNFSAVNDKPAIVLTSGNSITLENNEYSSTGVFELDLVGVPNGTTVTSDVAPTCINDNGACGVLVDGKIYTTVAQAAAVATSGSTVTLLHNSTETVEFVEGVTLNKNGFTADGVTVYVWDGLTISNLDQLKLFRDAVNAGDTYAGKTVTLTADIDLSGEANWTPIGNYTNQFKGTFDGQNHTISNLKINSTERNVGFFGATSNGEIKNLTINNAIVTAGRAVGVVVGTPYTSKLTNIKVTGHVEVTAEAYVGGVGGYQAYADWTDITVDVDATSFVKSTATALRAYVGGVIGFCGEGSQTFKNITSNIAVYGNTVDIGGITGIAHYGNTFENVSCSGNVTSLSSIAEDHAEAGGIAGVWHNNVGYTVTFTDIEYTGTITAPNVDGVTFPNGGLIGTAYNASNETPATSGSLIIDGKEAWLAVAKIGDKTFATVLEAIDYAVENGATEIKLLSDTRELMPTDIEIILKANLTITADTPVTAAFYNNGTSYDFVIDCEDYGDYDFTIGENVTFVLEDRIVWVGYYGSNIDVVVDGTLSCSQIWAGGDVYVNETGTLKSTDEAFVIRRGKTVFVDGGKIEANYFNILAGNIFAENGAEIECGALWIANTDSYANEGNVSITLRDSTLTSKGNLKSSSDGSVYIDVYDSTVEIKDVHGYGVSKLDANTTLYVNGESGSLTINKGIENNGTIEVYGGGELTLLTNASVTNNGSIILEAGSTIAGPDNMGVEVEADDKEVEYIDGKYVVVDKKVAYIGEQGYATLQAAVNAAESGDTITLLDSITLEKTAVVADKAITLDLAGHVISGNCNANQQALVCVENNAELMLKDSVGGGKVAFAQGTSNVGWAIDVKGKFVLESGIIELTGNWSIGYAVEVRPNSWGTEYTEGSSFVMNGGSIVSSDGGVRVASSSAEGHKNVSASFEMNGGSIDAAWDGVFIQQSDAIYDDLSFVMNGGTIESDLNPVRVYGPAPTGYVNDSNCMSITLAGGTMTYTGTEAQTWVIAGILRVGGGSSTATILENGSLTVSAEIAQSAAAPEGFKWVDNENGTYTLAACDYVAQIGETKYESLEDAFAAIPTDNSDVTITLLKDVVMGTIEVPGNTGWITLTAEQPVTIQQTTVSDFVMAERASKGLKIEKNVTFKVYDNSSGAYFYYGPSLIVNGTLTGGENWGCLYVFNGEHVVNAGATVSVGRVQSAFDTLTVCGTMDTNYLLIEGGKFIADGAIVDANVIYDNNNGGQRWGASTFEFKNGAKVTTTKLTLSYAETKLTMDLTSTLTANTVVGVGKIIVDATGFNGETKVISGDMSGFTGTIEIINNADVKYVVREDGLYVVAKDYVAQIGEKKFESVLEALQYAIGNNAAELKILTDVREQMINDFDLVINSDLTITADKAVKVEFFNRGTNYDFAVGSNNNNTLTIDENVHFDLTDRVIWLGFFGNNVDVVVEGYLGGYQIWHGADTTVTATGTLDSHGEAFIMRRDATLTVNGGKVHANYFQIYSGHIVAKDATIDAGLVWVNNNHGYGSEGTVSFDLDNTTFNINGEVKVNVGADKTAPITLTNGSAVTARGALTLGEGASIKADASSSFTVKGKSVFVAEVNGWKYTSLADAIAAAQDGETITLLADIDVGTGNALIRGKEITIDLNGHNITGTGYRVLFVDLLASQNKDGKLTLVGNGTVENTGTTSGNSYAVYVGGNSELVVKTGATVKSANGYAVFVAPMGAGRVSKLTVNGGTVTGRYAVSGSGQLTDTSTVITVNSGAVIGTEVGIYHPQPGTVTVNGGTVSGVEAALAMRRGTASITGGTIVGLIDVVGDYDATNVAITGGDFTNATLQYADGNGNVVTKADAVELTAPADYKWVNGVLTACEYVAEINGVKFESLADAIAAAQDGEVEILCNISESFAAIENVTLVTQVAGGVTITNLNTTDWISMVNVNIGSGVTLDMDNVFYEDAGVNTIEGTLKVGTLYNAYNAKTTVQNGGKIITTGMIVNRYHTDADAGIYVYGDGDDSTVEISCADTIGTYSGTFYAEDAVVEGNMLWIDYKKNSAEENDMYAQSTPIFENSVVRITKELRLYKDATLTLTDSTVTAGKVQVRENATPKVTMTNSTITAAAVENLAGALIEAIRDSEGNVTFKPMVAQVGTKNYSSLQAAIDAAAANGGEVVLLIPYVVEAGETVTLDLKGVTVKQSVACTASYDMILNKGTLTITDSVGGGKISFTDTSAGDPAATWGSYTIRNEGTLVIEKVTIENLSEQNVKGQAFAHTTLAIFQYSGSTTIESGKISTPNYRSVRLWSGEMTINGGEFEGQVWVQCVNDTSKLTINGGSFAPCWSDGSSVFVNNSGYEAELKITGGTFATKIGANDPAALNGDKIVGGTFTEAAKNNTNTALLGEDCVFVENADGTYGIVKVDYVAQVGDKKYESFDEALAAAQDGDTVQLISDVTVTDVITILKNITLDLNGHTLTAGGLAFFGYGAVVDNGEVTGLLAVPYRFLMMNNATYPMLPVWNEAGTGYVFTTVNPQAKVVSVDEDSFYVNFRPSISREGVSTLAWFANGAADHGISFAIKIHCFKDDRDVEAFEFVVEDEFIKTVYTNGTSFKLNVNGATTMFDEYKVEIIVASDTNIAYSTICSTTFIPSTVNAQ